MIRLRCHQTIPTMRSQLGRKILATLMCMASLLSSRPLLSQDASQLPGSSVDVQGVRHSWSNHKKNPPWMDDAIKKVPFQYPYEARARHITGSGLFRLTLDLSTGSVAKITVLKSMGNPILDNSALEAFRQWRWKPGKWKEIDIPVVFTMAPRLPRPPPGGEADFASAMTGLLQTSRSSQTARFISMHLYEIRPRKDKRGVNLISDALPFGRLWYAEPDAISNAIGSAKFRSPLASCCDSRLR